MRNIQNNIFSFFVLILFLGGCHTPDISEEDVNPVDASKIDTAAFFADRYQFPDSSWVLYPHPGRLGWDEQKLAETGRYADSLESAALMVIHKGVLVYDWGATGEKYITQSMRKGLLNSLYGIYWDKGVIKLDSTLRQLRITDTPPLTAREQQATIEHLLQSTSGIYHSALYEVGQWKRNKPARGSHKPGEHWYYNNWGFNALGTIFEQLSGQKIGDAFEKEIAEPLQMQDFTPGDVVYITQDDWAERWMDNTSEHPAYMFSTSARDMARFGLLYLNKGKWKDRQIISPEWIQKSWMPVDNDLYYALKFGYLWWMFENGIITDKEHPEFEGTVYFTSGNRGHAVFVIPYLDLVVVHRVYVKGVDFWSQMQRGMLGIYADVNDDDVYTMLKMIRDAHPKYNK